MIVRRSEFEAVLEVLRGCRELSLDTETTGLRPYHSDRLFSLAIASDTQAYYFNFQDYEGVGDALLSPRSYYLSQFEPLFSKREITWYLHNAKFDLHMLAEAGLFLSGRIHCTQAMARLVENNETSYSLDACVKRAKLYGEDEGKSDAVSEYIKQHKLFAREKVPGKNKRIKKLFFDRVPLEIISEYGSRDARVTYDLGGYQKRVLSEFASKLPGQLPALAYDIERDLTKTLFSVERRGLRIDQDFCRRAIGFECSRQEDARREFERLTGTPFKVSGKVFAQVFEGETFVLTEKGNPSFESDVLETFKHPAAKAVLTYRDAKAKADFYHGFLYHADSEGRVHTHLNQGGTATGRLSSSEPNFQNLKKDEDEDLTQEFVVRRAIVPPPGKYLFSLDYRQMEYQLMLDRAGCKGLIAQVLGGLDVHEATARLAGLTRKQAKTTNFAVLYGSGLKTLAKNLACSEDEARRIREAIFQAAPEMKVWIRSVMDTAKTRGWIFNWVGRKLAFPNPEECYKAPNHFIQGGCADIVKIAMNRIFELLRFYQTTMVLSVHDELLFEVPREEFFLIPEIKKIMESVYPAKALPLSCDVEYSSKSWADMETYPCGEEDRDQVQRVDCTQAEISS